MMQKRKYSSSSTGTQTSVIQAMASHFTELSGKNKLRGLLEKYPTFGREKETGLLGALDT